MRGLGDDGVCCTPPSPPLRARAGGKARRAGGALERDHGGAVLIFEPQRLPPPPGIKAPPLSFATRVGDLLFISGIPGFDAKGALPREFEAQFANVVANISRVLDAAGATFRDLVKVNVLLTRAADVADMNALYASAFGPAPYPARTTCVVQALPDPKMLIEIEAVAALTA
jgi:enamine deaminase RidA (YjgF/YER057c/UK114 family)